MSLGLDPIFLTRTAFAQRVGAPPTGPRRKTLVCLFQRGAVDGLSMVVPHGEATYYQDRPGIAIPRPGSPDGAIDLDGHFGLHPALSALEPWYRRGTLALVQAVGSPDVTRSHFDAQDFLESGTPGVKTTPDGWLNRQLAHATDHAATPFRGVALGPELPRILRGSAPTLAIDDLRTFGIHAQGKTGDRVSRAFEAMYDGAATGIVAQSSAEGFEAVRQLRSANLLEQPGAGAAYPGSTLGRALRQIAALIKGDLGVEVAFADASGWDTHVAQGGADGLLATRLRDLGDSLGAFATDLGERLADVVVLTMSEFGRTVAENGTNGTDHGHATAMILFGGGVRGGQVLGRWPGLDPADRYQGRDLAITTDFRDLFGEVLTRHLGTTDLTTVFPGYPPDPRRWVGALA